MGGGSSAAANGYDEFLQGRAETIDIERDGLRDMLEAVAVVRETDAEARRITAMPKPRATSG